MSEISAGDRKQPWNKSFITYCSISPLNPTLSISNPHPLVQSCCLGGGPPRCWGRCPPPLGCWPGTCGHPWGPSWSACLCSFPPGVWSPAGTDSLSSSHWSGGRNQVSCRSFIPPVLMFTFRMRSPSCRVPSLAASPVSVMCLMKIWLPSLSPYSGEENLQSELFLLLLSASHLSLPNSYHRWSSFSPAWFWWVGGRSPDWAASCTPMTSVAACFRVRCGLVCCCGRGSCGRLGCRCRQSSAAFVWAGPGPAGWNGRRLESAWWSLGSGSCEGVSQSEEWRMQRSDNSNGTRIKPGGSSLLTTLAVLPHVLRIWMV